MRPPARRGAGFYYCTKCGVTFLQQLPDVDERSQMTRRLARYIEQQSIHRTFTSVAGDGSKESVICGVSNTRFRIAVLPCTIVNIESGLSRNNLCLVPNLPGIAPTDQNFQIRVDGIQVVANTDGPVTVFGAHDSGESVEEAVDGEEG